MLKDQLDNDISVDRSEVIHAIDHFTNQLLRLGPEVDQILKAIEAFPNVFYLQTCGVLFYLYGQTKKAHQEAQLYLENAKQLLENYLTEREVSFYHGVKLWYENRLSEALKHFEKHCLKWRNDLIALKATEFLYYCKGQEYQGARFLDLVQSLYPKWRDNPLFLATYSFALELTGQYVEAEKEAKKGIDLDENNSWAHHTLSHVYINQGRIDEGIQVLESFVPIWKKSGRLIESHNLWHLSLMYLENLDFSKTLEVYDRADWKSKISMVSEEVDAAALLWRFDMEGQDVSKKWKELAEGINGRANFGSIPFVSAQLCYALKRGGKKEEVKESLRTLLCFTELQKGEDKKVWKEVGYPLIYGSLAFADQDYKTVLKYFDPIISEIGCCGGSDAQVALFRQTYLKSLIGARRRKDAKAFLAELTRGRPMTMLETKWLNETVS